MKSADTVSGRRAVKVRRGTKISFTALPNSFPENNFRGLTQAEFNSGGRGFADLRWKCWRAGFSGD